jgi:hypothetical protein
MAWSIVGLQGEGSKAEEETGVMVLSLAHASVCLIHKDKRM